MEILAHHAAYYAAISSGQFDWEGHGNNHSRLVKERIALLNVLPDDTEVRLISSTGSGLCKGCPYYRTTDCYSDTRREEALRNHIENGIFFGRLPLTLGDLRGMSDRNIQSILGTIRSLSLIK